MTKEGMTMDVIHIEVDLDQSQVRVRQPCPVGLLNAVVLMGLEVCGAGAIYSGELSKSLGCSIVIVPSKDVGERLDTKEEGAYEYDDESVGPTAEERRALHTPLPVDAHGQPVPCERAADRKAREATWDRLRRLGVRSWAPAPAEAFKAATLALHAATAHEQAAWHAYAEQLELRRNVPELEAAHESAKRETRAALDALLALVTLAPSEDADEQCP